MVAFIEAVYRFLWGDIITIPLPGGNSLGLSLLVILLIPTGIYFTVRTKFLPIRLFPDMVRALKGKKEEKNSLSTFQTLVVSTATRVGMGNLVGVVAAVSAGGAGAVFWMWVTALIGSSTAFVEATLAQLYKEKDPLYGGFRGGPAYYIHRYFERKSGKKKNHVWLAVLFAVSGLICWCGISQVISNSHSTDLHNDCTCDRGSDYRSSKKCDSKGIGYYGADHGSVLFCHYHFHYCEKYRKYAGSIRKNL